MEIKNKYSNKILVEFSVDDKEYAIVKPNAKITKEARYSYSKKFTECIKEGFFTKVSLEAILKRQDPSFFEEYNNSRAVLLEDMVTTENAIEVSRSPDEIEALSAMLSVYRAKMFAEDQAMNDLFSNTADQIAEEEHLLTLASRTVVYKDSMEKVWDSKDTMLEDTNTVSVLEAAKYRLLCDKYGLDPEWQEKLPEVEARNKATKIRSEEVLAKAKKTARRKKAQTTTSRKATNNKSKAATKGKRKRASIKKD